MEKREFEPRITHLRQPVAKLEEQAHQLANEAALHEELQLIIGRLEDVAAQVRDGLEEADWTSPRELIHALVKRVEVDHDQVHVVFRVDHRLGDLAPEKKFKIVGGVGSPLLANLLLHDVFDKWRDPTFPDQPWARYADEGVVHCRTEAEARQLLAALQERFKACGLALHPDKTRIVDYTDDGRRGAYPETRFDFLGYTFRPRRAKNRDGKCFVSFTPAVSNDAATDMRQMIHGQRMHLGLNPTSLLPGAIRDHGVLRPEK